MQAKHDIYETDYSAWIEGQLAITVTDYSIHQDLACFRHGALTSHRCLRTFPPRFPTEQLDKMTGKVLKPGKRGPKTKDRDGE